MLQCVAVCFCVLHRVAVQIVAACCSVLQRGTVRECQREKDLENGIIYEPYTHSKEPYTHSKEPYKHSKECHVHAKEPHIQKSPTDTTNTWGMASSMSASTSTLAKLIPNLCTPQVDTRTCHVSHMNTSRHVTWYTYEQVMSCVTQIIPTLCTRWRRLIGSPKLQIIFHKRATKYRSLLWKMTYKDKGSYESSPLCMSKSTNLYV